MGNIETAHLVLTAIGLAGGGVSWYFATASKKARNEANEAKEIAKKSQEALAKQATTLEEILETLRAKDTAPPWKITPCGNERFMLENTKSEPLRNVRVEATDPNSDILADGFPCTIQGHSQKTFGFVETLASGMNREIEIIWTAPDLTEKRWQADLP